MTRIEYTVKDNEFSLRCLGHAGFAEIGNDIVCAGISTLVQTLTTHIPEVTTDYDIHIEPGDAWCYGKGEGAVNCFEVILTGLRLLESAYPQHLSIEKGVL